VLIEHPAAKVAVFEDVESEQAEATKRPMATSRSDRRKFPMVQE